MKLFWPLLLAVSLVGCGNPAAPSSARKVQKMADYDPNAGTDTSNGSNDWWTQNTPTGGGGFTPGSGFTNTSTVGASVPSGVPDPNNPGYDTNGWRIGATTSPNGSITVTDPALSGANVTSLNGVVTNRPNPTFGTGGTDGGGASFGGPVATYSGSPYPTFTAPPLPDSLKNPWTLPTAADVQNTPGYQSRYQQGLKALDQGAAAHGTILNGGTRKAEARYGSDYADQAYQTDVNNSLQQRQQASNDYLNLAYGPAWQQNQSAVNQYGQLYSQYRNLIGDNRNSQNDYFNQQLGLLNAGLDAAKSGAVGTGGQG